MLSLVRRMLPAMLPAMLSALALTVVVSCTSRVEPTILSGAGATFPEPIYREWIQAFNAQNQDIGITYEGVGSTAGVERFVDGMIDFGASDAAMTPSEIDNVAGGVLLVPMTAGCVTLSYNLEDFDGEQLRLSREAYVGIFSNKIKKWNDKIIQDCNLGATLPDIDIKVVVRQKGSGTTYVFTKHLDAVSKNLKRSNPNWTTDGVPEVSDMPHWAVDEARLIRGIGNAGMSADIKQNDGAIGYVEYSQSEESNLTTARLQNKAGSYVDATLASASDAVGSVNLEDYKDLIVWLSDPQGDKSYPIVGFTWMLVRKNMHDSDKRLALKQFLDYCLTDGQIKCESLYYVKLPNSSTAVIKKRVDEILGR